MSKARQATQHKKNAKGRQKIECKQDANKLDFIHRALLHYKAGAHSVQVQQVHITDLLGTKEDELAKHTELCSLKIISWFPRDPPIALSLSQRHEVLEDKILENVKYCSINRRDGKAKRPSLKGNANRLLLTRKPNKRPNQRSVVKFEVMKPTPRRRCFANRPQSNYA